ncbi:MAG: VanW family protein [Candidatus Daviesbacteria bacterium]
MEKKIKKYPWKKFLLIFLAFLTGIFYLYIAFFLYFSHKIYPGVKINGENLGGKTYDDISKQFKNGFQERLSNPLKFKFEDQTFTLDLSKASPKTNLDQIINEAYQVGHSQNYYQDAISQFQALLFGINFSTKVSFRQPAQLTFQLNQINQIIKNNPVSAKINLGKDIIIIPSSSGQELDDKKILSQIEDYLNLTGPKPNNLPLKIIQPKFTTQDATYYQNILTSVKNDPIKLYWEDLPAGRQETITLDQKTLMDILNFNEERVEDPQIQIGQNVNPAKKLLSQKKLEVFLEDLILEINRPVQDAKFNFDPSSKRVSEFKPAQEGRELDLNQTAILITNALTSSSPKDIDLPVKKTLPKIGTGEVNDFGITGLLGEGLSNFSGSIDNRIYNIRLAASRLNGNLIAPGKIFSFNSAVGDISAATGYKQAYIIKEGRTVLDDGGGVCQVSTTLFRAVLNSGLPVTKRTAHAYRVGYYEQGFPPGLDATVFAPSVDFQFKNDTSSYVLIQAHAFGLTLYVDLYGSPDGRVVTISKPKVTDQTPPPPELRQDDPTLPRGTVKQVDWPAWGANVVFSRIVTKNGEVIISENWKSAFKPWQAIYLVGTKD